MRIERTVNAIDAIGIELISDERCKLDEDGNIALEGALAAEESTMIDAGAFG